jgi:hypothetical protein
MTCTERIKLLAKFISNAGIDLISVAAGLFVVAVACIGSTLASQPAVTEEYNLTPEELASRHRHQGDPRRRVRSGRV